MPTPTPTCNKLYDSVRSDIIFFTAETQINVHKSIDVLSKIADEPQNIVAAADAAQTRM